MNEGTRLKKHHQLDPFLMLLTVGSCRLAMASVSVQPYMWLQGYASVINPHTQGSNFDARTKPQM